MAFYHSNSAQTNRMTKDVFHLSFIKDKRRLEVVVALNCNPNSEG